MYGWAARARLRAAAAGGVCARRLRGRLRPPRLARPAGTRDLAGLLPRDRARRRRRWAGLRARGRRPRDAAVRDRRDGAREYAGARGRAARRPARVLHSRGDRGRLLRATRQADARPVVPRPRRGAEDCAARGRHGAPDARRDLRAHRRACERRVAVRGARRRDRRGVRRAAPWGAAHVGRELTDEETEEIQRRHGAIFRGLLPERRPLPGAAELLAELRRRGIVHGIATSGRRPEIDASLEALGIGEETVVIDRGNVPRAKPAPDLFLACQQALGGEAEDCYVVGDAVWDLLAARRARMLSIGLLSGGYGADELLAAGAFRVYEDAAELHRSLDELGFD